MTAELFLISEIRVNTLRSVHPTKQQSRIGGGLQTWFKYSPHVTSGSIKMQKPHLGETLKSAELEHTGCVCRLRSPVPCATLQKCVNTGRNISVHPLLEGQGR